MGALHSEHVEGGFVLLINIEQTLCLPPPPAHGFTAMHRPTGYCSYGVCEKILVWLQIANTTFDGVPIMTASMPEFGLKTLCAKESLCSHCSGFPPRARFPPPLLPPPSPSGAARFLLLPPCVANARLASPGGLPGASLHGQLLLEEQLCSLPSDDDVYPSMFTL